MTTEKRLIDAKRLKRRLERFEEFMVEFGNVEAAKATRAIINGLKIEPIVDAVEVVHGRWLPDMEEFDDDPAVGIRGGVFQTGWKCSICGRSEQVKEPYCNCGAKMDAEKR